MALARGRVTGAGATGREYLYPAYVDHRIAQLMEETIMTWNTPTLIEICIGLEINGYLPAEF
jgi:coenzyme PQQ precursor peptide PqqA